MVNYENEDRADYLIRVIHEFMEQTPAGSECLFYDDANCDGMCLADDIEGEITFLKQQRDELLAALNVMVGNTEADSDEAIAAHRQARAAIAKAEA